MHPEQTSTRSSRGGISPVRVSEMKMEIALAASYFWSATMIQKLIIIQLLSIILHCEGK